MREKEIDFINSKNELIKKYLQHPQLKCQIIRRLFAINEGSCALELLKMDREELPHNINLYKKMIMLITENSKRIEEMNLLDEFVSFLLSLQFQEPFETFVNLQTVSSILPPKKILSNFSNAKKYFMTLADLSENTEPFVYLNCLDILCRLSVLSISEEEFEYHKRRVEIKKVDEGNIMKYENVFVDLFNKIPLKSPEKLFANVEFADKSEFNKNYFWSLLLEKKPIEYSKEIVLFLKLQNIKYIVSNDFIELEEYQYESLTKIIFEMKGFYKNKQEENSISCKESQAENLEMCDEDKAVEKEKVKEDIQSIKPSPTDVKWKDRFKRVYANKQVLYSHWKPESHEDLGFSDRVESIKGAYMALETKQNKISALLKSNENLFQLLQEEYTEAVTSFNTKADRNNEEYWRIQKEKLLEEKKGEMWCNNKKEIKTPYNTAKHSFNENCSDKTSRKNTSKINVKVFQKTFGSKNSSSKSVTSYSSSHNANTSTKSPLNGSNSKKFTQGLFSDKSKSTNTSRNLNRSNVFKSEQKK